MNSTATQSNESSQQKTEPDILNFERQLREVLHELQLKRLQTEESREALNIAMMKQYELKQALDSEHRNAKETYAQLELALSTAKKWEEERINLIQENSRQQVQLETTMSERDTLRDQFRNFQVENVRLRNTIEELEGQMKCQQACQESCLSSQNKMSSSMKELNKQIQQLEQDQNRLETAVESINKLFTPLKLRAEHIYHVQEEEHQKRSSLEKKLFSLEAELGRLRSVKINHLPNEVVDDTKDYRNEARIMELESRLKTETEANEQLQSSLANAFTAQTNFQQMEEAASSKLKYLMAELLMKQKYIAQIEAENNILQKECQLLHEESEKYKISESEEKRKITEQKSTGIQVNICRMEDFDNFNEEDKYLSHVESGKQVTPNQPAPEVNLKAVVNREIASAEEHGKD